MSQEQINLHAVESLQDDGPFAIVRESILRRNKILLTTSSANKIEEATGILQNLNVGLEIDGRKIEGLTEIQGTIEEIAGQKAIEAYWKVGQVMKQEDMNAGGLPLIPVIEDSGLFIYDSDGKHFLRLPGPYVKDYFVDTPEGEDEVLYGCKNIIAQHKGKNAEARSILAVSPNGRDVLYFMGVAKGRIADEAPTERGFGFGFDGAFIPDGFDVPMSQIHPQLKNTMSMRANAYQKLVNWLYQPQTTA